MLSQPGNGLLGQVQAWFHPSQDDRSNLPAFAEASSSSSSSVSMERRKKELEEQLQRDLERLAEERKEGLHRIDWQLAEAVENLHTEAVEKAQERIQLHKQAVAQLEGRSVLPRDFSMAESTTAHSEQESNDHDRSAASSQSESEDEEEPGVWNDMVDFFHRNVTIKSGSLFAWRDLQDASGMSGLGSKPGLDSPGVGMLGLSNQPGLGSPGAGTPKRMVSAQAYPTSPSLSSQSSQSFRHRSNRPPIATPPPPPPAAPSPFAEDHLPPPPPPLPASTSPDPLGISRRGLASSWPRAS